MASELTFGIELKDGMSGPARQAALSIQQLGKAMSAAQKEDLRLTNQLGRMHSAALAEDKTRTATKLGLIEKEKQALAAVPSALSMIGDAASVAFSGFVKLGEAVSAFTALTVGVLAFANEATEAKDHAVALFQAMGDGTEGSGEKTLKLLDELSTQLPQNRKELTAWTREFEALGITDLGQLRTQLKATASAQALVGESGSEAYTTLTRKIQAFIETGQGLKLPVKGLGSLAKVGLDVKEVATEMGLSAAQLGAQLKAGTADATKFGAALESALIKKGSAPLTNLNLELSTVLSKGWASFTKLFDSIDFRPLSDALHFLFATLDEGEDHGNMLKDGITGALDDIVAGFREVTVEATVFFLDLKTWAVENRGALREMWAFAKDGASLFWTVLKEVGSELRTIGGYVVKLGEALGFVADKLGLIDVGAHALTPAEFDRKHQRDNVDAYARSHGAGEGGRPFETAPAHARGGLVMRPAPGEAFASVAPGERILPREESRAYSARAMIQESPYAGNESRGGGHHVTIDRVELHVNAPQGVTDATDVSARALAVALERYQLASGR